MIGFVLTESITQGCPVLTSDQVAEMSNKEDTDEDHKSLTSIEEKHRPKVDSAAVYTRLLDRVCLYKVIRYRVCVCVQGY